MVTDLSYEFYKRIIHTYGGVIYDISVICSNVCAAGVSTAVSRKQNCDDTAQTLSDTHLVFSVSSSPILGIPVKQQ